VKWIEKIPLLLILPIAVFLALAPFRPEPQVFLALAPFRPEPHLWEKLNMLFDGTLSRPIDIFDLFLHGTPLIILVLKLYMWVRNPSGTPMTSSGSPGG
jgi:hypothetical protein